MRHLRHLRAGGAGIRAERARMDTRDCSRSTRASSIWAARRQDVMSPRAIRGCSRATTLVGVFFSNIAWPIPVEMTRSGAAECHSSAARSKQACSHELSVRWAGAHFARRVLPGTSGMRAAARAAWCGRAARTRSTSGARTSRPVCSAPRPVQSAPWSLLAPALNAAGSCQVALWRLSGGISAALGPVVVAGGKGAPRLLLRCLVCDEFPVP